MVYARDLYDYPLSERIPFSCLLLALKVVSPALVVALTIGLRVKTMAFSMLHLLHFYTLYGECGVESSDNVQVQLSRGILD